MKKTARNDTERTGDTPQPQLSLALHELVRRDLREFVVSAGMAALAAVLEQERAAVCGPRYEHDPDLGRPPGGPHLGLSSRWVAGGPGCAARAPAGSTAAR
jgi:hypothetical protein